MNESTNKSGIIEMNPAELILQVAIEIVAFYKFFCFKRSCQVIIVSRLPAFEFASPLYPTIRHLLVAQ